MGWNGKRREVAMIAAREVDEYRKCDLASCGKRARWEFTKTGQLGRPYRVFVCAGHQVEGFVRVKELGNRPTRPEGVEQGK